MLDFDPLYSTPQIGTVEQFIDRHYALSAPVSCKLLQRGLNDVYLVTAAGGARYVFRLSHHRARGPADVGSETAFLLHLSRSGVPVAAPIATRDGALFLTGQAPEGPRAGVLFQAIEGREPQASDAGDAWQTGKTLALLHNAAETYSCRDTLYRLDLEHLLHRPLARVRDSGIIEDVQIRRELEEIADRTATAINGFSGLTWTYCHGDSHGFNARIDAAGDAVFFDFDDGGTGYLAYDLAVFLWAKISFGRDLTGMWHAFQDGYRAFRPIAEADSEAVFRFVIVRHFWMMGEYASRAPEWGMNSVGWIARQADFLRIWESDQVTERLF